MYRSYIYIYIYIYIYVCVCVVDKSGQYFLCWQDRPCGSWNVPYVIGTQPLSLYISSYNHSFSKNDLCSRNWVLQQKMQCSNASCHFCLTPPPPLSLSSLSLSLPLTLSLYIYINWTIAVKTVIILITCHIMHSVRVSKSRKYPMGITATNWYNS